MLRLIIKGDKFQAARAAAHRGIPLAFVREIREATWCETIGTTKLEAESQVRDWFNEPPYNAPFPIGALLHFSY